MKYILVVIATFFLTGCVTMLGKPEFPPAEKSLMVECKELGKLTTDPVTISQLMTSVVENYTLYYQCANKVKGWQEWYEKQKKNYNGESTDDDKLEHD